MEDKQSKVVSLCADLMKKVIHPGTLDKELLKISEVLSALNENTKSVNIKRGLLKEPWPGVVDFLSSHKNGYFLVLFSPTDINSKGKTKRTLISCGVPPERIKTEVVVSQKTIQGFMEDRDCRVVMYKGSIAKDLKADLKKEFSVETQSFLESHIKQALAELKVRHEQ